MKTIAIIGAGAKAAAIVARAAVLRGLTGINVPKIVVFESHHVGAAWSGGKDFSSGFLALCTPGEKDVGFPYNEIGPSDTIKESLAPLIFSRFSWSAFLVATGRMSDWVDRGRDHPPHRVWADYLSWVFETAAQPITHAKVTELRPTSGRWDVHFDEGGISRALSFDGVVLTGPGQARSVPAALDIPPNMIFDAQTFWPARNSVLNLDEGIIAVAGAGGAAGTIVAWLAERFGENQFVQIYSIAPMGTLFPRGDGHAERRWFSDPGDWPSLSMSHRRMLLDRTEAGVVSMRVKAVIDQAINVGYRAGKLTKARWDQAAEEMILDIQYDGRPAHPLHAKYLVTAAGFDSWSLLGIVNHSSVATLLKAESEDQRRQVETDMMPDLTLPSAFGLPRGLHVPALAGLAHGPGMSNLGCLGLMAAAVLRPYVTR